MNIAKLQAQLQKVPDQALIGYVQNPDGQVPSYLALAELSRRKEIRKTATPKGPSPTQSVAAQEVSQVEPGVAGLPVRDDMYATESFADGGIVAFADGGLSESDLAYQEAINNTFLDKGYRGLSNMASGIGGYGMDVLTDLATLPGQARWVRDPVTGKLVHAYETEGWMPRSSDKAPARVAGKESANKILEQSRQEIAPKQTTPAILPYADPRVTADKNAAQIRADIAAGKYDKQAAPPAAALPPKARMSSATSEPLTYKPSADLSEEFDKNLRPEVSAQEAMAKYQGLLGTDVGRQKMQDRLAGMESKAAKEEAQAPWMALAEAGLGIAAGKSQFALQNIAEGGIKGIKSYTDAKDRMVKAEERRFDMASRIAQAERAEQVAAATYGLQSEEAARAGREANKMAKLGYKANRESDIAKGTYEAAKDKLKLQLEEKQLNIMQEHYRNSEGIQREANLISKSTALESKQRALYDKALDNARTDVMNNIKATGKEGVMTQAEFDTAIQARYLENLKAMGLPPLSSASGYKVLGVEEAKKK